MKNRVNGKEEKKWPKERIEEDLDLKGKKKGNLPRRAENGIPVRLGKENFDTGTPNENEGAKKKNNDYREKVVEWLVGGNNRNSSRQVLEKNEIHSGGGHGSRGAKNCINHLSSGWLGCVLSRLKQRLGTTD